MTDGTTDNEDQATSGAGELASIGGKRVLITGGSGGIGAALARGFAERGAIVGICARRTEELQHVLIELRALQPECQAWTTDLADLDAIDSFAASVNDEWGPVDILVNNAGIPKRRWSWELDPATVEAVMAINYFSPIRLTLAVLPGLMERQGAVVSISSVAARLSPPAEAAYSASKAALTAFMEGLRVDLLVAGRQVGVHVINPGVIDTPLFSMPDNDESLADIEALDATAMIEPVLDALRSGRFETWVPAWFADVAIAKTADIDGFLMGSAAYARDRLAMLGRTIA